MEDPGDVPQLSVETFAVLQQFYKEQEEKEAKLATVETSADENIQFSEDWQLSQFWYNDNTIETLVKIAIKTIGPNGKIALLSCPSLYKRMKKEAATTTEINVFEYDKRFAAFGTDFILYDYKTPLEVPQNKNHYDLVIADPPFLSDECLTKAAITMKYLSKEKIILCTGAIMADLAKRLLNLNKTKFEPHHQNNLANEFWCYSNYDIDTLL